MQDSELKKILLETCPVRPGQEGRAWEALRGQLFERPRSSSWNWLYRPGWRSACLTFAALTLVICLSDLVIALRHPLSFATASSESPGIYATTFYSNSAQAQVVWLNGLEPATDNPTYLDPTTVVGAPDASGSSPDSL